MSEALVVRHARRDDAEGFVRAHESAWDSTIGEIVGHSLDELAPYEARLERFRESIAGASERAQAWLAERSGQIVGIAVSVRDGEEAVELRDLYVVPEAWGTGVAQALTSAAIDGVRGEAREARLWVGEENARARRFYEREGWVADGTSRDSPLGPVELRYRRSLET